MSKNILMIVVDTLRADHLGCYGHSGGLTPRIDQAAADGIRFANYYSASDFTAAAFASMFTSLYPWQHGVYDFRIKTLPPSPCLEALRQAGYERKAIVDFGFFKSYLRQSFDSMEALTDLAHNWSTEAPIEEADRLVDWIAERDSDKPFFCFLHISPPHTPYRFPSDFYRRLEQRPEFAVGLEAFKADPLGGALLPDAIDGRIPDQAVSRFNEMYLSVNKVTMPEATRDFIKRIYAAEVEVVDHVIGRIVDGLSASGIANETIVSLSADHGEQLWEHGGYGHGISALYDEVVRTPWVLFGGDTGPAVVDANVSHTALLPTLVDVAGVTGSTEVIGKSARHLVQQVGSTTEPIFTETKRNVAVIRGRHKLITRNRRRRFSGANDRLRYVAARMRHRMGQYDERYELYDLIADPGEQVNIASRRRDVVEALQAAIDVFHATPPVSLDGWTALSADEESQIKKELAGLGYY